MPASQPWRARPTGSSLPGTACARGVYPWRAGSLLQGRARRAPSVLRTMAATSSRRGRPWPGPHVGPFGAVCGCCLGGCRGAPAHTSAPTAQRPSPGIGRSARSFVESRHAAEGWKRCHDGLTIALCGRRVASPLTTIRRMPHGGRHSSTTWTSSKCHGTRTLLAGRLLGLFSWHPAHVGEQRQTEDAGACPRAICHGKHTALTCTIWCNRRKRNLCSYDTL